MSQLLKTKKAYVDKDPKAAIDYWEQQFSTSYQIGKISNQNQKILKQLVSNLKPGLLLDNGCGDGRIKKFFEELGWTVFGTDISKNALLRASRLSPINLVHAFSESLPFKKDFFKAQLSWRVLHSLPKYFRQKAIKEMYRVLKKGGFLYCSVQSASDKTTINRYREYGLELEYDPLTFVVNIEVAKKKVQRLKHFYYQDDLINELESNTGFKVKDIFLYEEKSGWSNKKQSYWVATAKK